MLLCNENGCSMACILHLCLSCHLFSLLQTGCDIALITAHPYINPFSNSIVMNKYPSVKKCLKKILPIPETHPSHAFFLIRTKLATFQNQLYRIPRNESCPPDIVPAMIPHVLSLLTFQIQFGTPATFFVARSSVAVKSLGSTGHI